MFVVLAMFGVIAGNVRGIAMMTMVTLLIEPDRRDRANGLVGTTTGVTMLATSVISGLLVARDGMFSVLLLTMTLLVAGLIHLGWSRWTRAAPPSCARRLRRGTAEPPSRRPTRSTSRAPSARCARCPVCSP